MCATTNGFEDGAIFWSMSMSRFNLSLDTAFNQPSDGLIVE